MHVARPIPVAAPVTTTALSEGEGFVNLGDSERRRHFTMTNVDATTKKAETEAATVVEDIDDYWSEVDGCL